MAEEPSVLFFTPLWDSNAFPIFHGVYKSRMEADAELAKQQASLSWMTFPSKGVVKTFQELGVTWDDFLPYIHTLNAIDKTPASDRLSAICNFRQERDKLHYRFLEVGPVKSKKV